jgi:hypothetical protein
MLKVPLEPGEKLRIRDSGYVDSVLNVRHYDFVLAVGVIRKVRAWKMPTSVTEGSVACLVLSVIKAG